MIIDTRELQITAVRRHNGRIWLTLHHSYGANQPDDITLSEEEARTLLDELRAVLEPSGKRSGPNAYLAPANA